MTDIDARREARRRKILENSGRRLQKITGVQERNTSFDIDGYKSTQINGEAHAHSSITPNPQIQEHFNNFAERSPINAPLGATSTSRPTQYDYLKKYRTAIVILIASFVNILSSVSEVYNIQFVNKIFIPLLCFEAVWFFCKSEEKDENSIVKYLILFKSNKGQQLAWVLRYLAIIKTTFRDIVIYFFAFVCILYIRDIAFIS